MNPIKVTPLKQSGSKTWAHATSDDERALARLAERLGTTVKQDGRGQHVDLSQHQRELALRYGAVEDSSGS